MRQYNQPHVGLEQADVLWGLWLKDRGLLKIHQVLLPNLKENLQDAYYVTFRFVYLTILGDTQTAAFCVELLLAITRNAKETY